MSRLTVLDLFCGAGGLASGFARAGYDVTGIDYLDSVPEIFRKNRIGTAEVVNLHHQTVNGGYDLVVGGPPCRPWSSVNLVKRELDHESHRYVGRFASHVIKNSPEAFMMENVPPARKEAERASSRLQSAGYSTRIELVRYSDYGAPTSRRRLILVGTRGGDPSAWLAELERMRRSPSTVRQAIGHLRDSPRDSLPDHSYPDFTTVENYIDRYESGRYGWYRLAWDSAAPSFGNVMKTYTLHPESWEGVPPRVISIKEALLLMGFERSFAFPTGMGVGRRYQMVADSVSPMFAWAAAKAFNKVLL